MQRIPVLKLGCLCPDARIPSSASWSDSNRCSDLIMHPRYRSLWYTHGSNSHPLLFLPPLSLSPFVSSARPPAHQDSVEESNFAFCRTHGEFPLVFHQAQLNLPWNSRLPSGILSRCVLFDSARLLGLLPLDRSSWIGLLGSIRVCYLRTHIMARRVDSVLSAVSPKPRIIHKSCPSLSCPQPTSPPCTRPGRPVFPGETFLTIARRCWSRFSARLTLLTLFSIASQHLIINPSITHHAFQCHRRTHSSAAARPPSCSEQAGPASLPRKGPNGPSDGLGFFRLFLGCRFGPADLPPSP